MALRRAATLSGRPLSFSGLPLQRCGRPFLPYSVVAKELANHSRPRHVGRLTTSCTVRREAAARPPPEGEFDPSLPVQDSWTPPSAWYTSPLIFEQEKEKIFGNTWHYVGRADQVAQKGQYLVGRVVGQPYVVVRAADADAQGEGLRAYFNVCRHHANILVDEGSPPQPLNEFTCCYHGYTMPTTTSLLSFQRSQPYANQNQRWHLHFRICLLSLFAGGNTLLRDS